MIFKSKEIPNRAKQILEMIVDGPKSNGLLPAVPKDTEMQEVFESSDGTLIVDTDAAAGVPRCHKDRSRRVLNQLKSRLLPSKKLDCPGEGDRRFIAGAVDIAHFRSRDFG